MRTFPLQFLTSGDRGGTSNHSIPGGSVPLFQRARAHRLNAEAQCITISVTFIGRTNQVSKGDFLERVFCRTCDRRDCRKGWRIVRARDRDRDGLCCAIGGAVRRVHFKRHRRVGLQRLDSTVIGHKLVLTVGRIQIESSVSRNSLNGEAG